MKLSMYILEKWYKKQGYTVTSAINDGEPRLMGARISDEVSSGASAYISSKNSEFGLVSIRNRNDTLFITGTSSEEVLNETNAAFEYYNVWEASLLRGAFQGYSLQELLDHANMAITRPMLIKNSRTEICAITDSYGPQIHPLWGDYLKHINNLPFRVNDYGHSFNELTELSTKKEPAIAFSPVYGASFMYANIWINNHRVGYITAYEHGVPFDQCDLELISVFQNITSFYVAANPEILFMRTPIEEYMTAAALGQTSLTPPIEDIYHAKEWSDADTFFMFIVQQKKRVIGDRLTDLQEQLAPRLHRLESVIEGNMLIGLLNLSQSEMQPKDVISILIEMIDPASFHWSTGYKFSGIRNLFAEFKKATFSLNFAKEKEIPYLDNAEALTQILLSEATKTKDYDLMLHPAYKTLKEFDRENSTQYTTAFFWYLFYNHNLMNVSTIMEVHRNTVNNWLLRIGEFINIDEFDAPYTRLAYLITYLTKESFPK